jgi:CDP-glucose 4,6-dehydratase
LEDLEVVGPSRQFWRGKRVLVTGDSGFKGSWLTLWLNELGAEIHGVSLPPDQRPNLYSLAKVRKISKTHFVDIRQASQVRKVIGKIKPQIIFHLAAQPIVRVGYTEAKKTWETNLNGTIHLLEAARKLPSLKVIIVVTTDKVYRNSEKGASFVESDPLGGSDPYSASKAAADLATSSYQKVFFEKMGVGVATARAGNVIGGGDWARDRIVTDALRAGRTGKAQ